MKLDIQYMVDIFPLMITSAKNTIIIALVSLFISLILGVIIALIIQNKVKVVSSLAKVYVSFFRGTPVLIQLYIIYFGLPRAIDAFAKMSPYTAIIISLSLNMAAYMSETIRGAISSVDKGQYEAGASIGLTNLQIFRRIVFPQAIRVALPSLANSFVDLIKGSSLAFTIGVVELMSTANMEGAATYKFLEAFTVAAIVYWIIALIFDSLQRKIEFKLSRAY